MRLSLCPAHAADVRPARKPILNRDAKGQIGTLAIAAVIAAPIGFLGWVEIENVWAAALCGALSFSTLLGFLAEPANRQH